MTALEIVFIILFGNCSFYCSKHLIFVLNAMGVICNKHIARDLRFEGVYPERVGLELTVVLTTLTYCFCFIQACIKVMRK